MTYLSVGQRTFLELMTELEDIIESDRYDVPSLIKTDLKAAKITIAAADDSFITTMLTTLALLLIPLEDRIQREDVEFFKQLQVCKHCDKDTPSKEKSSEARHGSTKGGSECICVSFCSKKCKCMGNCINCSQVLKDLDSKTFNAIKYIVEQAADGGKEEKQDIDVIFMFIKSILALVKTHKKR